MADAGDCSPWPEEPPPPGVDCAEFGLAGHGRLVWGEGNPAGPVMIVLDNPGAREDPKGDPYVCGSRLTLRRAMAAAGLPEQAVYLTYLLKCRPRRAYDHPWAWAVGLRHLERQWRDKNPAIIVLLGDVVVRAVTGQATASVRATRGRTLRVQGITAVTGYHPLAARRRPNLYPLLVADLQRATEKIKPS